MKRYFVDTCVLIWFIEENKRVSDIYYDLEYYQGDFFTSMESITELFYLIQSGKVKINISISKLIEYFNQVNIKILPFDLKALDILKELPFFKEHNDPTDRKIIAHAIANNCTLISGDSNFTLYEKNGLKHIEV